MFDWFRPAVLSNLVSEPRSKSCDNFAGWINVEIHYLLDNFVFHVSLETKLLSLEFDFHVFDLLLAYRSRCVQGYTEVDQE